MRALGLFAARSESDPPRSDDESILAPNQFCFQLPAADDVQARMGVAFFGRSSQSNSKWVLQEERASVEDMERVTQSPRLSQPIWIYRRQSKNQLR
jgi:hypothetical protein